LFATGGTAVSGILLAPVGLMFYRRLTAINRALAAVGSFFFAAGLVAAVLDRIAPSTHCDLLPRLRNQVALAR